VLLAELSVLRVFILSLPLQISLVGELPVQVPLQGLSFHHQSRVFILSSSELVTGSVKGLAGPSELEFFSVRQLGEFVCSLLGFVEVIVDTLDPGIVVLALSLLDCYRVSHSIDFILVLGLLLPHLGQLVLQVVCVFPKPISLVALGACLPCERHAFLLPSTNLVSNRRNLGLIFVVGPVLFVKQEAQVFDFFPASHGGDRVLVVTIVVVVVLHELFVLEMSVLLLDGVQLVSQGDVILVSLLNFEDLCLELGNEEIFLV